MPAESPYECRIIGSETECGGPVIALELFVPLKDRYRVFKRAIMDNQSQWYLDNGHIEIATPECLGARENALYETASFALFAHRLKAIPDEDREELPPLRIYKNNRPTDRRGRALTGISWGSHGNYLTYRGLEFHDLQTRLVPLLASRLPLIGNGWINIDADWSIQFLFSQRGDLIGEGADGRLTAAETTGDIKTPINTRDRPYANHDRWRRYHDITENSTMSEYQIWLKRGMMDLVLLMIEHPEFLKKLVPAAWNMQFVNARNAFKFFNRDMYTPIVLQNGRRMSALDIQEFYLDELNRFFLYEYDALTEERRELLRFWRAVVDALRRKDHAYAEKYLDWAAVFSYLVEPAIARIGIKELHQCDPFADTETRLKRRTVPSTRMIDTPRGSVRIASELLYRIVEYSYVDTQKSPYGVLLRNGRIASLFTPEQINNAMRIPPRRTRAACREEILQILKKHLIAGAVQIRSFRWDEICFVHAKNLADSYPLQLQLPDPYRSSLTTHEKVIFGLDNF